MLQLEYKLTYAFLQFSSQNGIELLVQYHQNQWHSKIPA